MKNQILGIDASNIRAGGGLTHLVEFLRVAEPVNFGFVKVIIWAPRTTLNCIDERSWLVKRSSPLLDLNYVARSIWQRFELDFLAKMEGVTLLFVPGGTVFSKFYPVVTLSQNLLPFDWNELARYGFSLTSLRLLLLRWTQSRSFIKAQGTIFLSHFAKNTVQKVTGILEGDTNIIPHGVDQRFISMPRQQHPMSCYNDKEPFTLIYVSIIDAYKHQWNVAEAVSKLRLQGYPIIIKFIGPAYPPAFQRFQRTLLKLDPEGAYLNYIGPISFQELHKHYICADLCVFASSCENLPNILIEGMASGLPIACSDRGPMPEALADAGIYFDPENPNSISGAIKILLDSPELRAKTAETAYIRANTYSWAKCANDTLDFLNKVYNKHTFQR